MKIQKTRCRELTPDERRETKLLVTKKCANYDKSYGCLPLDADCYMLNKWWSGALCKYFQNAVLPLNPVLEAGLMGYDDGKSYKLCPVCGTPYIPKTSKAYCSRACAAKGRLASYRKYNRKRDKSRR